MIPNPIQKVLSTLSTHQVRYLLMGGQACVFYVAAEFSRDCDIAILCEPQNLSRLQAALDELQARTSRCRRSKRITYCGDTPSIFVAKHPTCKTCGST